VDDLFRLRGRYTYANGINPRAIIALVVSIAPVVPGFIRAVSTPGGAVANPNFFDRLYSYAWFVTFALSFIIYWLLMRREPVSLSPSKP
jgi:NCS1 family nucleobase:cation symporter-1